MADLDERAAFTSNQVLRLVDISRRQLDYWIHRGIVAPDVERGSGRGRVRLFSFLNLLELRAAAWLRGKVSLQLIRKIVQRLREHGLDRPLSEARFAIGPNYEVFMQLPDGTWEGSKKPAQIVLEVTVPVERFTRELSDTIEKDRQRRRQVGKIERRRGALGSTPVLAGTRIPTKAIWALHRAGYSTDRILESYPGLEPDDIEAALSQERERRRTRSA